MSFADDAELLTTTEAARLTGRSISAIRAAIHGSYLPRASRTDSGRPLVQRGDVLRWAGQRPPAHRPLTDCYDRTREALAEIGPVTAEELALYLGLHAGNVRKHLVVLARDGRVRRQQPSGDWIIVTPLPHHGAA